MAGIFGSMGGRGNGSGILGGQQQPEWANTLGILSSGLMDAASNFSGRGSTDNLSKWQQRSQSAEARQQLMAGLDTSDPAAMKQAILAYTLAGGDASPIISAMQFGQPKTESYGEGQNVFEVDPLTGTRKQVQVGKRPAPSGYDFGADGKLIPLPGGPADPMNEKAPSGYQWDPLHKRLGVIPGYVGGAAEIAAARRAPPKAAKPSINLAHPGSLY